MDQLDGMVHRPLCVLALVNLLASCNTPSIGFAADKREKVEFGGHQFEVFLKEDRAQVVRLNRIKLSQAREATRAARAAVEQVSECRVAEVLKGSDQVLLKVSLDCG